MSFHVFCFLYMGFLKLYLFTGLLNLLVLYHFNCLSVYSIPFQVWLFFKVGTLCQRRLIVANLFLAYA